MSDFFPFIIKIDHFFFTLLCVLILILLKKFLNGGVCHLKDDLTSKVIIITGANRGIGLETAQTLSKMGGTIIMACRDIKKAEESKQQTMKATNNFKIEIMYLDLSDLKSVREFATIFKSKYQRLDILINNAGIICPERKITKDGFERMIGTNHFGHFLLTNLLMDVLKKSQPSRIINVSSLAHTYGYLNLDDINSEKFYFDHLTYGGSKLANILFTNELASKIEGTGVKTCSLHPGVIRSGFIRNVITRNIILKFLIVTLHPLWWFLTKNTQQGSQTSLYCSLIQHNELENGKYYSDCRKKDTRSMANDKNMMKKLWVISEEMTKS